MSGPMFKNKQKVAVINANVNESQRCASIVSEHTWFPFICVESFLFWCTHTHKILIEQLQLHVCRCDFYISSSSWSDDWRVESQRNNCPTYPLFLKFIFLWSIMIICVYFCLFASNTHNKIYKKCHVFISFYLCIFNAPCRFFTICKNISKVFFPSYMWIFIFFVAITSHSNRDVKIKFSHRTVTIVRKGSERTTHVQQKKNEWKGHNCIICVFEEFLMIWITNQKCLCNKRCLFYYFMYLNIFTRCKVVCVSVCVCVFRVIFFSIQTITKIFSKYFFDCCYYFYCGISSPVCVFIVTF